MEQEFTYIRDIHFINSNVSSLDSLREMYSNGLFSAVKLPENLSQEIPGLSDNIKSPLKRRMSQLSLGVYQALQNGGAKNLREDDEIYLFTSFAEIDTSNKIIADLELNQSKLVSPVLFHNSVHNTPLGYYTIINKYHNYKTYQDLKFYVLFQNILEEYSMANSFLSTKTLPSNLSLKFLGKDKNSSPFSHVL